MLLRLRLTCFSLCICTLLISVAFAKNAYMDLNTNESANEAPVYFADPFLKAAVENELGIDDPTPTDMRSLFFLVADNRRISDLTGIECAQNLLYLSLEGNFIFDLSPLSQLTNLMELWLDTNQISDLSHLSQLTNLTVLLLNDNQISDLSPLSKLTSLTGLYLNSNQISDLLPLSQLTNLNILWLIDNQISDISPLSELTNLTELWLFDNQIFNLSPLSRLTNLKELNLDINWIFDVSALSQLKSLTTLYLSINLIDDISALSQLMNLTKLDLSNNMIDDISALSQLTNLTKLDLSNNYIYDISALSQLTNLTELDLSTNQISDLSPLSQLTNLAFLDLRGNLLSCTAYCVDIPAIENRNSSISIFFEDDSKPTDCICPPQEETVFFVDVSADSNNDGTSWSRAFKHLQDALKASSCGDEIRVAQGVYRPDRGLDITFGDYNASFHIKSGVTVKGGYPGLRVTDMNGIEIDPNQRDTERFETILTGDLAGNDDKNWIGDKDDPSRQENSRHVVSVAYTDSTTLLDGFTIMAGHASDSSGGGTTDENNAGGLTIIDCKFLDNYANSFGGGLYCSYPILVDCEFINNHSGNSGGGVYVRRANVQSCLFHSNSAKQGGGAYSITDVTYSDCLFDGNSAQYAGALSAPIFTLIDRTDPFNDPFIDVVTFNNVDIQNNFAAPYQPDIGYFRYWILNLEGDLNLKDGRLDVSSVLFDGIGELNIADRAVLRIVGGPLSYPTVIQSVVNGPGNIVIDQGTQLILDGNSIVNLSGLKDELPDPNAGGRIIVGGSLVVQGNATIESTNIEVKLFDVNTPNDIQYNNIALKEASTGFGGEFFVAENATIKCNNIVSEGDRYLDLDPDPLAVNLPAIENNRITVIIKGGKLSNQGTLLELRARNHHGIEESGAYPVSWDDDDFSEDQANNWVLEKLELESNTKLNLTNRQGFEFQALNEPYPETVYVKELVLGPNSVLNTALQTMYYQRLVDPNGLELVRDPDDFNAPLENGAKFMDIPLLGFSLVIIAMNDQTEFDVRVRKDPININSTNPNDQYIRRLDGIDSIPSGAGGIMEMRTRVSDEEQAEIVRAKGAFARAGDEDITVKFEYMFLDDPYDEAELIVYLSDHPEVGRQLRKVARIRPPLEGRLGAIGSGQFAVFSGTFPKDDLNFTRGTYVELELRGQGARCWIDNWDPQVICGDDKCGDYDDDNVINLRDYLMLIAGYGLPDPNGSILGCLDLIPDGCIGPDDLLAWHDSILNACGRRPEESESVSESSFGPRLFSSRQNPKSMTETDESLLICGISKGKNDLPVGNIDRQLYLVDPNTVRVTPDDSLKAPPGNGRFIRDSQNQNYQIVNDRGIVEYVTNTTVAGQQWQVTPPNSHHQVTVGLNDAESVSVSNSVPLLDAAFAPHDNTIVYVVPVWVQAPDSNIPYLAAAKLELGSQGNYTITELYGVHPALDTEQSTVLEEKPVNFNFAYDPDKQHLHEIETDADGYIYVLSSVTKTSAAEQIKDYYVLVFKDGLGPVPVGSQCLNDMEVVAPTALLISMTGDRLYLASSVNPQDAPQTFVYEYNIHKASESVTLSYTREYAIDYPVPYVDDTMKDLVETDSYVVSVMDMIEGSDHNVYVTGFTAPRFREDVEWDLFDTVVSLIHPILARIVPGADQPVEAQVIEDTSSDRPLLIPLSMVLSETNP